MTSDETEECDCRESHRLGPLTTYRLIHLIVQFTYDKNMRKAFVKQKYRRQNNRLYL
jgi:hypothetical protein